MQQLLTAIKATIRGRLNYLSPNDIFLAVHENILPGHIKRLGLGIKDGPISRKELAGGMLETTLSVNLVLWSGWINDEERLLGSNKGRGIIQFAKDIHEALDENLLDLPGIIEAFAPAESASEPYGNESRAMQRKIITYQYVKEETRP